MRYTIIYQNTCGELGLVSWLGDTCESYTAAVEIGKQFCESHKDDMPNMTFFVLKHLFEWITEYEKH